MYVLLDFILHFIAGGPFGWIDGFVVRHLKGAVVLRKMHSSSLLPPAIFMPVVFLKLGAKRDAISA
ncbi:MAG TPA: hypothetical protein DDX92_10810 [Flavobacteriales bacterium]|nr:hypothetical protein [Flavobacteriales bacterium]